MYHQTEHYGTILQKLKHFGITNLVPSNRFDHKINSFSCKNMIISFSPVEDYLITANSALLSLFAVRSVHIRLPLER